MQYNKLNMPDWEKGLRKQKLEEIKNVLIP